MITRLVMGLGTSRSWWPSGLCRSFAEEDFQVVRYDQRDAGQATRMPEVSAANPIAALFRKRGDAYTAEDMIDDAVAVLDALGWSAAHVFAHSLGGAIAQRIALRHPDRVLSVVVSAALPQRRLRREGGPLSALRPACPTGQDEVARGA